jgi:hypothetical protein
MFKKLVQFIKTTFKRSPIPASTVVSQPYEDVVKAPLATDGFYGDLDTSVEAEPEKKKRGRKKKTEEQ